MFQFCSVILLFPGKKIMFEHIVGDYCLKFIHYKFKYNLKKPTFTILVDRIERQGISELQNDFFFQLWSKI